MGSSVSLVLTMATPTMEAIRLMAWTMSGKRMPLMPKTG